MVMTVMNSVIWTMPVLDKAIIGHLIIMAFLSALAIYIVLKSQNRTSSFLPLIVLIPTLCYFCYSLYTMSHTSFEITSAGLTIVSGLQSRIIDVEKIQDVSCIDSDFKPKLRICGFSLPGYKRGWFHKGYNNR